MFKHLLKLSLAIGGIISVGCSRNSMDSINVIPSTNVVLMANTNTILNPTNFVSTNKNIPPALPDITVSTTKTKSGKRMFIVNTDEYAILENSVDSLSVYMTSEMLKGHEAIINELKEQEQKAILTIDPFTKDDVEAVYKIIYSHVNLNEFIPVKLGSVIEFYPRFALLTLIGKIDGNGINIYLIRLPNGQWRYVESKSM